ncbi:Putative hemolysin [Acidisarcina polymorpha]|uniref:Hemolysin n=1 Tax=Acidisarcina polymorpha TaxID=2211140 RepID=A0A2Z5FVT4_9BACT|nr:GNAT family N-acyltransferase [Acidisarcina polymorpha]AXC10485.1 Putative hemolysin [Acidisarcina polymorpha]
MDPAITAPKYIDPAPVVEDANPGWVPMDLGRYRVTIAQTLGERESACRLRFKVFNIELGEGLQASYKTGLDTDHFDLFCDQLIVEDRSSRSIVGTYRMQSGITAARNLGYYCEQEFDFRPYAKVRDAVLELGRASIDREHRSSEVLTLLWRGIAQYTRLHNLRYLIGCSSLNSQDPRVGWQMYRQLSGFQVAPEFQTSPTDSFLLPFTDEAPEVMAKVPKLLRTYIGIGAKICGAPAWDREFGTIDFLTLLDMRELTPAARVRFQTEAQ